LCNTPECSRWTCEKLHAHNVTILPKNSTKERQKFGNKLIIPDELQPEKREHNDIRPVLKSFPKYVKAIVVHKKILVKESVINQINVDNMCLEVTLLGNGGKIMNGYEKALFEPGVVNHWCTKSVNSLVAHQF